MADYARNKKFFSAATLIMLCIAAYVSISLVWHAPVPGPWRVPLTLGLVLFALSVTTMRVLVTKKPDLPFSFVRAGGFISSAFMALSWLVLLRDAFMLAAALCGFALPCLSETVHALLCFLLSGPFELGMLAASFGLSTFGLLRALRVPDVREVPVPVPGLPCELEGLRLVQISDLHIGACFGRDWLKKVVHRINALEPDLVLITGDLADGSTERIKEHLRPLADLRARYGVFAVPGNHDYYSGLASWIQKWRGWGLCVLLNSHRDILVQGQRIRVAGVNDKCARHFPEFRHSEELGPPDLLRALNTPEHGGPQNAPAALTLLLSHRPAGAEASAASGVSLQLSGHTHAGQFFFLFPLVSRMNKGFRAGLYRVAGMPLHVSPGTGMWGYAPMRCGTQSEISLLTLTRS